MKTVFLHIATQIRAARIKAGLSQRALSEEIGIPQSHLSKIEQGKVDLQVSTLIQIARYLRLEPMLVPVQYTKAVRYFDRDPKAPPIPAYQPEEGDEND